MQEKKTITAYKKGLREVILNTAMKAFAEKGIRAVKMDDIAESLAISKRTMYEIYATKEELLYQGVKVYHERQKAKFIELSKGMDVMEILLKVYHMKVEEANATNPQFYDDLIRYPQVRRFLDHEKTHSRENMMQFFERGVQEGYFRDDINYELAARLFDALGRYIREERLYKKYSIKDIFKGMPLVLVRGICTEKGINKLQQMSR
jgi:AcrR family transcriptional regulator